MKRTIFVVTAIIACVNIYGMGTKSVQQSSLINNVYEQLQKLENTQIELCKEITPMEVCNFTDPLYGIPLTIFSLFNPQIYDTSFDEKCGNRCILDFSKFSFAEVVGSFIQILQSKLSARIGRRAGKYNTKYKPLQRIEGSDDEDSIDPYYVKILADNEYFNFSLDYNGNSDQPGNCVIRKSIHPQYRSNQDLRQNLNEKQEKALEWKYIKSKSKLETFVLATEIARRKVCDGEKKDKYKDLPIWCAIVMAQALDKQPYKYKIFSGNKRLDGIKSIIDEFMCKHNLQNESDVIEKVTILIRNGFPVDNESCTARFDRLYGKKN